MIGPTAGHSTRTYKRIGVHPDGRIHPEQTRLECEAPGCHNEVTPATSYSFVVIFATTGGSGLDAYQCGDEQHFCCSPAHARQAAIACLDHLIDDLARRQSDQAEQAEHAARGEGMK